MLGNHVKNRTTEKDIRTWLNANGFQGQASQVTDVELHAVQRPGWLQIFGFRVQSATGEYFGVVRDDERLRGKGRTQIELFDNQNSQAAKLAELSRDLIVRGDRSSGYLSFLFLFGFLLLAFTAAMFKLFSQSP